MVILGREGLLDGQTHRHRLKEDFTKKEISVDVGFEINEKY